jgi:hypothetical protein
MGADKTNEKLGVLIENVVWRVLSGVHTSFPAKITKVKKSKTNALTTIVDVVAGLGELNQDSESPEPVEILNVPLVYPGRTGNFIIRPPVDEASLLGAFVKISVSDTFLADWKKTGGTNLTITDSRRFDRRDAIAEFGFYPDSMPWATKAKDGTAQMKVGPGTFLEIGNSTADIPRMLADILSIIAQPDTNGGTLAAVSSTISGKNPVQLAADIATLFNPDPTP